MQASCTPSIEVSNQIFRPIKFVHLAHQAGGILHSHPTLHKVGPPQVYLL